MTHLEQFKAMLDACTVTLVAGYKEYREVHRTSSDGGQTWQDEPSGCTIIEASHNFVIPDNIRVPLADDSRVSEALKLCSEKIALLNQVPKEWVSGELVYHYSPNLWDRKQRLEARIGMLLAKANSQSHPSKAAPKIGRNSSCPCGSGKRYKRCCGK